MVEVSRWPPWPVTSVRSNLDDLVATTQDAAADKVASEILSSLSRFLVVRTSGYVEQAVHEVVRAFVSGKSGGQVRTFAHSWLERSRNPSPEALGGLLGRFDAALQAEFEAYLDEDDQRLKRDLSFLVDRRNAIAHGLNEGVGYERALTLVASAVHVVDWFILRLNPNR